MLKTIAIVGLGATGVSLLSQLIKQLKEKETTEIIIFNSDHAPARGIAYSSESNSFLLNMRTETMSIWPEKPNDFVDYLKDQNLAESPYLPRHIFGDYLEARWHDAIKTANDKNIKIIFRNEEVTDIDYNGRYYEITAKNSKLKVDYFALCLGNPSPTDHYGLANNAGYIHSAYTELNKNNILNVEDLTILGTSLTAIDILMYLVKDCNFKGNLTLISRHGLIPTVQANSLMNLLPIEIDDALNKIGSLHDAVRLILNRIDSPLSYEDLIKIKNKSFSTPVERLKYYIHRATNKLDLCWYETLNRISGSIPMLWQKVPIEERLFFLKNYNSQWMAFRHSMPLPTARNLLTILEEKKVKIMGGIKNVKLDKNQGFTVETLEGNYKSDLVINATGGDYDIRKDKKLLTKNLLRKGLITPHTCGGVCIDVKTYNILTSEKKVLANGFFIGPLTKGECFYTNSLEMNALQAKTVAEIISKSIRQ